MYNTGYSNNPPVFDVEPAAEQKYAITNGALGPFFSMENPPAVKPMKVTEDGFMSYNEDTFDTQYMDAATRKKVQNKVAFNMSIIIDWRLAKLLTRERDFRILNSVAQARRTAQNLPYLSSQSQKLQGSIAAALTYYTMRKLPEELRLYRALTEFNEEVIHLILAGIAYVGQQRALNSEGNNPLAGEKLDIQTNDDLYEISEYIAHKLYSYFKVEMRSGSRTNWNKHSTNSTIRNNKWYSGPLSSGKTLLRKLAKLNPLPLGEKKAKQLASIRERAPYPIPTTAQITTYRNSINALNKSRNSIYRLNLTKKAYHRHTGFFDQIASLVRNVMRISIGITNVNGAAPPNPSKGDRVGSYGRFLSSKNRDEYVPKTGYDDAGDELNGEFSLREASKTWEERRDAASTQCADAVRAWEDVMDSGTEEEKLDAIDVLNLAVISEDAKRNPGCEDAQKSFDGVPAPVAAAAEQRRQRRMKTALADGEVADRAARLGIDSVQYLNGHPIDDYVDLDDDERENFDRDVRQRLEDAAAAAAAPPPAAPPGQRGLVLGLAPPPLPPPRGAVPPPPLRQRGLVLGVQPRPPQVPPPPPPPPQAPVRPRLLVPPPLPQPPPADAAMAPRAGPAADAENFAGGSARTRRRRHIKRRKTRRPH
jgi:hypothetical protein